MESKNPVFNEKTLSKIGLGVAEQNQVMTVHGTINKVGILLLLTAVSSAISWNVADTSMGFIFAIGSIITNLILCLVIVRNKELSSTLAPVYALVEGLSLGFITFWFERAAHGIAVHALASTFGILAFMLFLYRSRLIVVTDTLRSVIVLSTLGIACIYIFDLCLRFFGHSIPMIHQNGIYGILFSVGVVIIASLSLVLDFDMIEKAAEKSMPKWMEWYAGFSVLITIIWLYMEILRLLSKARD